MNNNDSNNDMSVLTNTQYQTISLPTPIYNQIINGQSVNQFYGVVCQTTYQPAYWESQTILITTYSFPDGSKFKLTNGIVLNGKIISYEVLPSLSTSSNQSQKYYIKFQCEMHVPFVGVFLADCNMNADISNNTNFTNFIKSFDYTLTSMSRICLDDFIGNTISGELSLNNKFASLKYIWKR